MNERIDVESFDVVVAADFNACIEDVEIDGLTAKRFFFTWSNNSGGMGDKSRVNRAMVNHK